MGFLVVIVMICLAFLAWSQLKLKGRKLPPGPYPLPIVGNIFQVAATSPHESFAQLSKKYGPLMSIRFGSSLNVVVSSPEMAREVLTRQGFTGRHVVQAGKSHDHDKFSMVFLSVADNKWKDMRKICKEQMFTNHILETSQWLRQQKLRQLLDYVQKCCDAGRAVNIRDAAFITTLNLMSATLFSADATEFDSSVTSEMKEIIEGVSTIIGVRNYADYFPILKSLDPQGVRRGADLYYGRMLRLINTQIDQRLEWRRANPNAPKPDDLLEILVDITQGSEYSFTLEDVAHLLFDLYIAGTESTTISIEWIMTELLVHPDVLLKAKNEVRNVMGDRKIIEEEDVSRLPYLQAVIKEVFRFHPPGPLLLPRKAGQDMEINGYFIPKDTQLLVNAWAIGRDPSVWPNAESFEPERFFNNNIDFKGQNLELIPFGSGRRICPGLPLAHRIAHTAVAALIHNFDWMFAAGESERNRESLSGLALGREAPLMAIAEKP